MFPDQQNQDGGQPGPGPVSNQAPQQNAVGQYQVVPPLPSGQNNGHTGHNPYEFIVNAEAKKKSLGLPGGNSFFGRLAIIVGGVILLMIIAGVVLSALGPKSPTASLTAIAQRQQEIVRIASSAVGNASSQDAKNFAVNVEAVVASSQSQIVGYLTSHGTKVDGKVLALDHSAQTDALLTNAQTTNTYDKAVVENLSSQIGTYQQLIQTTFKQASSKQLKQILQHSYADTGVLAAQAKKLGS